MSHKATAWAIEQRGITATQFRVLIALADAHNPAHGCFPDQERLAADCEMTTRTVRECLSSLEEMNLISRERLSGKFGQRVGTRYFLAFEDLPEKSSHREPTGKNTSSLPEDEDHPYRKNLPVYNKEESVIEPVIEPVIYMGDQDLFSEPAGESNPTKKKKGPARAKRGCRFDAAGIEALPADWHNYAMEKGFSWQGAVDEFERFRNHWLAASGKNAVKMDWTATWRNWVMSPYNEGRRNGQSANISRYQTPGERNHESTINAFRRVFAAPGAGD